jgi:hypothetical protein
MKITKAYALIADGIILVFCFLSKWGVIGNIVFIQDASQQPLGRKSSVKVT